MRGLAWGVYNGRVQRGVGERDMVTGTFAHAHTHPYPLPLLTQSLMEF